MLIERQSRVALFLFIIFLAICTYKTFDDLHAQSIQDTLEYKILSIKKGDICIVCDVPLKNGEGIAFLLKGRRVTIDLDHFSEFISNQAKYFGKLEPRGALFQESAVVTQALRSAWFVLGIVILMALLCAATCSHFALKKGYSPGVWFIRGLIFNIIGVFIILTKRVKEEVKLTPGLGKLLVTASPQECPDCKEYNHPSAEICIGCGENLTPETESEVKRV